MSNATKFFDVECAYGRARNLKEFRHVIKKTFAKRVKKVAVFPNGMRSPFIARLAIDLHKNTDVDFSAIQREELNDRGYILHELAANGLPVSLFDPVAEVSPETIPVTIRVVPATKPIAKPKQLPTRRPRRRIAA